jgi:hypothetical protein
MQMDLLRVTETTIIFSGSDLGKTFGGVIDRVTGETKAGLTILNTRTTPNKVALDHDYALKCRPAQRMF